jgi:glucokinase
LKVASNSLAKYFAKSLVPRNNLLTMKAPQSAAVGIDLGGTGTRFAMISAGKVLARSEVATDALGAGTPAERVSRMSAVVTGMLPDGYRLGGVGIGASGPVLLPSGTISNPDTLPWFSDFDLVGMLAKELGAPVAIDNDAVAWALAERHFGAGRGCGRLLVVTLGTGIGVAFLDGGLPYRDRGGQHPECGHLPVDPRGPHCYCGLVGCWEMVASRLSLEARASSVTGTPDLAVAYDLLKAGHPVLEAVLVDYGHAVGRGLELLNVAYGPDRAVLAGSVSRFVPYFAPGMAKELGHRPGFSNDLEVVASALGAFGGAMGASVLGSTSASAAAAPLSNGDGDLLTEEEMPRLDAEPTGDLGAE